MKRAVVYVRVSTSRQVTTWTNEDGISLSAQEKICSEYAARLGAEVLHIYKERGKSARKRDKRDQLAKLLEDISGQTPVDYVVVYKLDRLARNTVDDAQLSTEIRAAGAILVSATEDIDDTTSDGWFMKTQKAVFAEYEVRKSGERVSGAMLRKVELGGTPGVPQLGYLNYREAAVNGGRGVAQIIVDEERAQYIPIAFELYATGEYSLSRLTRELEELGLRSRPRRRNALPRPLNKNEVHKLLRNRYYIGWVSYKGEEYEGGHPHLVDEGLFDKVQAMLASRAQNHTRYRTHDHYLKGTIFCARCQGRFYELRPKNSQGNVYAYFCCRGRKDGTCSTRYLNIDLVEEQVERLYKQSWLTTEQTTAIRAQLRDNFQRIDDENEEVVAAQQARLERLTKEEQKNLIAHREDALSMEALKAESARITDERKDTRRVIRRASVRYTDLKDIIEQALDLVDNWQQAYRVASPRVRRLLNQAFFERIVVDEDEAHMVLSEPYRRLKDRDIFTTSVQAEITHRTHYERSAPTPTQPGVRHQRPGQASAAAASEPLRPRNVQSAYPNTDLQEVGCSDKHFMVGHEGFEPPTSSASCG